MVNWWEALTTLERIFAFVACPAALVLIIQTILLIVGFGSDADADSDFDADADAGTDFDGDSDFGADSDFDADTDHDVHHDSMPHDHDAGLRVFTFRGFIAFFTIFGWGGLALMKLGSGAIVALIISIILGSLFMLLDAVIMRAVIKMQSDGTVDYRNAVGEVGSVYIPIPPNREGSGKITVIIQERLCECDAVTDENSKLKTGTDVVVTGLADSDTLIVETKV